MLFFSQYSLLIIYLAWHSLPPHAASRVRRAIFPSGRRRRRRVAVGSSGAKRPWNLNRAFIAQCTHIFGMPRRANCMLVLTAFFTPSPIISWQFLTWSFFVFPLSTNDGRQERGCVYKKNHFLAYYSTSDFTSTSLHFSRLRNSHLFLVHILTVFLIKFSDILPNFFATFPTETRRDAMPAAAVGTAVKLGWKTCMTTSLHIVVIRTCLSFAGNVRMASSLKMSACHKSWSKVAKKLLKEATSIHTILATCSNAGLCPAGPPYLSSALKSKVSGP